MIKYSLICADGHRFESWFASANAFEKLVASGMVSCAVCGSGKVEKAMMAPNVKSSERKPEPARPDAEHPLSAPATTAEKAIAELRKRVEAESDYVGRDFAREARAIHEGEAPQRSIHGEANMQEARSLIEDGVPVTPLPFAPRRKTN
ncbi:DUF1178 family protein [Aliiruegeria lutimaris]|uniref:DUF1178 family protein n=1 Tax=Aliiruegeria lutimaris TaxID=571298 RepID=A0A1G8V8I0_9RHOB|nr:DUF1178 family protein [Aliiruegeria lutimaris]SDJ61635.1 hypothetical protein SAMN04488026_102092 [Aliiruegeria lutimaris]